MTNQFFFNKIYPIPNTQNKPNFLSQTVKLNFKLIPIIEITFTSNQSLFRLIKICHIDLSSVYNYIHISHFVLLQLQFKIKISKI